MGLKLFLKQQIMRSIMKKRKVDKKFDDIASEYHESPADAASDINNSYYFSVHNMNGTSLFFRFAKRGGGENTMAEVWTALRNPDGTAFVNKDKLMKIKDSTVTVRCIEPLKQWEFTFKGKMIPVKPNKDLIAEPCGNEVESEFKGIFKTDTPLYEFSRDTDLTPFSLGIAAEKWEKGFADELNHAHQIHIEQDGYVKGNFSVGGNNYQIDSQAVRDHSFGRRSWSYMNQHKWFTAVLDGGGAVNVNAVKYPPINVRGLKTGYKMQKEKTLNVIDWDIQGSKTSGTYTVKYADKSKEACSYKADILFPFDFADEKGSYIIYEGVSEFTVNGIRGRGITEFGYNGDKNRWSGF